jgi:uncharacterized membrane protein
MTVLLYIIAGLFLLMSIGLFSGFAASQNLGLLLGGLAYGVGGAVALALTSWWPLVVGLLLAFLLRTIGSRPGH